MNLLLKRLLIMTLALSMTFTSLPMLLPSASAETSGNSVVNEAEKYLGRTVKGFDSADFVSYVFKNEGVDLPSSLYDLSKQGTFLSKANLAPGDLVYFGTSPSKLRAVGIYVGDQQFIVAYQVYGKIKKMSLNDYASKKYYLGAKRVITEARQPDNSTSGGSNSIGVAPLKPGTYTPFRNNFGDLRTWSPTGPTERSHEGIDISAPNGTPIYSAADGKIIRYGWNYYGGWRLSIAYNDNTYLYYAHMDRYAPGLYEGATVKKGQLIGYVGKTGYGPVGTEGSRNHLHFGIYQNGTAINPYPYLKKWEQEAQ